MPFSSGRKEYQCRDNYKDTGGSVPLMSDLLLYRSSTFSGVSLNSHLKLLIYIEYWLVDREKASASLTAQENAIPLKNPLESSLTATNMLRLIPGKQQPYRTRQFVPLKGPRLEANSWSNWKTL